MVRSVNTLAAIAFAAVNGVHEDPSIGTSV
jgi:hypothetical protein